MRGDALQTFKNINGPTGENLGEILVVFRRKYVKPHSMATAKHKFQKLVFNPANHKLVDFRDELQKLAKENTKPTESLNACLDQETLRIEPPNQKNT